MISDCCDVFANFSLLDVDVSFSLFRVVDVVLVCLFLNVSDVSDAIVLIVYMLMKKNVIEMRRPLNYLKNYFLHHLMTKKTTIRNHSRF